MHKSVVSTCVFSILALFGSMSQASDTELNTQDQAFIQQITSQYAAGDEAHCMNQVKFMNSDMNGAGELSVWIGQAGAAAVSSPTATICFGCQEAIQEQIQFGRTRRNELNDSSLSMQHAALRAISNQKAQEIVHILNQSGYACDPTVGTSVEITKQGLMGSRLLNQIVK
jgi:hypothetical protein